MREGRWEGAFTTTNKYPANIVVPDAENDFQVFQIYIISSFLIDHL